MLRLKKKGRKGICVRHKEKKAGFLFLLFLLFLRFDASSSDFPVKGVSFPAEYARGNVTYLVRNEITPLLFYFHGDRTGLENPAVIIETPAGIKVVYAFHVGYWNLAPAELRVERIEGNTEGTKYKIALDAERMKRYLPDLLNVFDPTRLAVFLEPESAAADDSVLKWHVTDTVGQGEVKSVAVKVLPALEIPEQKPDFRLYFYVTHLLQAPDKDIRDRLLALYEKVGIRGGLNNCSAVSRHSPEVSERMELYSEASIGGWGGGFWGVGAGVLAEGLSMDKRDLLVVLKNGEKTRKANAVCQTWILENEKYFVEKLTAELTKSYYPGATAGFLNNYEIPYDSDVSWRNGCFCPRCKSAFVECTRLNVRAEDLTPDEILAKYRKEWIDFRYWQNGQMVRLYNLAVKAVNPELKTVLCSVPVPENRESSYHPIDSTEYDEYVDEHWPMFYGQSPDMFRAMDREVKKLKRPVLPTLNTCYPINEYNTWPPDLVRLNTIAAASAGCRGVCYFTGDISADGEYLSAINSAYRELSGIEKFYKTGKRNDLFATLEHLPWKELTVNGRKNVFPGMGNHVFYNLYQHGSACLVTLFNYHIEFPAFLKISFSGIPDGEYIVTFPAEKRYLSGTENDADWKSADLKNGLYCKIPPLGVQFMLVEPRDRQAVVPADYRAVSERGIRQELEGMKVQRFSTGELKPLAHWTCDGKDGGMDIKGAGTAGEGVAGGALLFDGEGGYAEITDKSATEPLRDSFSLELWIYPESFSVNHNMTFIRKRNSFGLWWFQPTNVLACDIYSNGVRYWMDLANCLEEERWNHVVMTYAGGYLRFYHNGSEVANHYVGKGIDRSEYPLTISADGVPFKGMIDEVRIYDRGLDGRQVWENYLSGLAGTGGVKVPTEKNLLRNGDFEEGLAGWGDVQGYREHFSFAPDDETAFSGSGSLRIESLPPHSEDKYAWIGQSISLQRGKTYKLSFYVHAGTKTKAKQYVHLHWPGQKTYSSYEIQASGPADWHNWHKQEFYFAALANTVTVNLPFAGSGRMWIDNMVLTESALPDASKDIMRHGSLFTYCPRGKEEPPLKQLSQEEQKKGYLSYFRKNPRDTYPYSVPKRDEITESIIITATPGESLSSWFSIYALKKLKNVNVHISESSDGGGKRRSVSENIEIRTVKSWEQRTGWRSTTYYIIPELLVTNRPVDVLQGATQTFWLTVRIPEGISPGDYPVKIDIEPEGEAKTVLNFTVRVLPFVLEKPEETHWGMWWASNGYDKKGFEEIERELADMKEHGINTLLVDVAALGDSTFRYEFGAMEYFSPKLQAIQGMRKTLNMKGPLILYWDDALEPTALKSAGKEMMDLNSPEGRKIIKDAFVSLDKSTSPLKLI